MSDRCVHLIGRTCRIGAFVDPSPMTCLKACDKRVAATPLTIGGAIHGAAGIVKAIVGANAATPETIAHRRETCRTCEHNSGGAIQRCNLCGCALAAKTRLKSERCPAKKWSASGVFDRAAVINLDRRPERYARFVAGLPRDWPFPVPKRLSAIDGWAIPSPWGTGMAGAHGCSLSHRKALRDAIDAGATSVLILEDDALFGPNFAARAIAFVAAVEVHDPGWEMLLFGGQPLVGCAPVPIGNGIARSVGTNRFHAYGVRGPLIRDLLTRLERSTGHCDIEPWDMLKTRRVYEPHPTYLAGQAAGWSDIASKDEGVRAWGQSSGVTPPTVYLRGSRESMEAKSREGYYFGSHRGDDGVDTWLATHTGEDEIRAFLAGIIGEAELIGATPAIWHPTLPPDLIRRAMPGPWREQGEGAPGLKAGR